MKSLKWIGLGLLCLSAPAWGEERTLPEPPETSFVYFSADKVSAQTNSEKLTLEGNVEIVEQLPDGKTRYIRGEHLSYDQQNTLVTSQGPVSIEGDQGDVIRASDISVNYTTKDFTASQLSAQYPPIQVISAEKITSQNGKKVLKNAVVTCCGNPDPHYTLSVGRLSVSPQQRVFGTNAVLKLNNFPIFYLPVFWRSLDSQKPWTTYVEFTQSNKTGFGVLTSTNFPAVLQLRPRLNLDFYTKSGVGVGGQLSAVESPTLHGSGEVYYINDQAHYDDITLTDSKRWGVQGGYWWEMYDSSDHLNNEGGAMYQFQTKFRMVSDPYFYDSFFRSNPYIFMPDQDTTLAVSRQTRRTTLRVSYQQKDIYSWDKYKFLAEKRVLPEVKFAVLPVNDPLFKTANRFEVDFNNTSTLRYKNQPNPEEGPYQRQMHAKWTMEKSLRVSRGLTFMPSAFYDQKVTFADGNYENKDAWVSRIGTKANMQTHTFLGSTDFGYEFTKRLSTGTLVSDHESLDKGIEKNSLYLKNYFRPSLKTYVRFETGFNLADTSTNLRTGLLEEVGWEHLKSRIEPLLLEIGYNADRWSIFLQDQYDMERKNINFLAQSYFSVKAHTFGLGVNNFADYTDPDSLYSTDADRFTFTTSWGLRPEHSKWRADLGIDFSVLRGSWNGFNKYIRLGRDFHDASAEIYVRDRNKNLSFAFRINILCGGKERTEAAAQTQDTYWYPWRNEGDLRD